MWLRRGKMKCSEEKLQEGKTGWYMVHDFSRGIKALSGVPNMVITVITKP
jgi:hypothetical protein